MTKPNPFLNTNANLPYPVTSTSRDVVRSAFMLFVWAQFELQVGIMCASAPTLRVFFRRYLGGGQTSSGESQGTAVRRKSLAVFRDTTREPVGSDSSRGRSLEKKEFLELRDLGPTGSEDVGDEFSMSDRVRDRDLTRYSHEEDMVQLSRSR